MGYGEGGGMGRRDKVEEGASQVSNAEKGESVFLSTHCFCFIVVTFFNSDLSTRFS